MRTITHRYCDPLDRIWLATATRIGLRVERTDQAYASTDGRGALTIGTDDTLDPDDCLAQMIFHELCHSMIEGPDAFARPDWGLDNASARDRQREHACLRLQASLSAEYGLRRVLAPTTDFRTFYDGLGPDPLASRREPSVALAILGLQRADRPPWAPYVRHALQATADIARAAGTFADTTDDNALPTLWTRVDPMPGRHPTGFPHRAQPEADQASGSPSRAPDDAPPATCGTCAWHYRGGLGRAVDRCRQADGARVAPEWSACNRWEPTLDCQECGACCREAYHSVTISRREAIAKTHPDLVVDRGAYIELRRTGDPRGNRCIALRGGPDGRDPDRTGWQPYSCEVYSERPRPCRELEAGGPHCLTARRRVGLSR